MPARVGWDPSRTYTGDPRIGRFQFFDGVTLHSLSLTAPGISQRVEWRRSVARKGAAPRGRRSAPGPVPRARISSRALYARNFTVVKQRDSGMTYDAIARVHGVSAARVRQIVERFGGDPWTPR